LRGCTFKSALERVRRIVEMQATSALRWNWSANAPIADLP
jgi:hypothetical protein